MVTFYSNHANHWTLTGLNPTQDIVEITLKPENIEMPPKDADEIVNNEDLDQTVPLRAV